MLFGKGKFDDALEIISKSEHPAFITKVRMKQLKAKCLYELDEFELFESEYKAIYHFLRNNKSLSLKLQTDTKVLFDYIKKLFRLRQKFSLFECAEFKKEISASDISKSNWVMMKLNELSK